MVSIIVLIFQFLLIITEMQLFFNIFVKFHNLSQSTRAYISFWLFLIEILFGYSMNTSHIWGALEKLYEDIIEGDQSLVSFKFPYLTKIWKRILKLPDSPWTLVTLYIAKSFSETLKASWKN